MGFSSFWCTLRGTRIETQCRGFIVKLVETWVSVALHVYNGNAAATATAIANDDDEPKIYFDL